VSESGLFLLIFQVEEVSRVLGDSSAFGPGDTTFSLAWSFLVMPMMPFCVLRVLFMHSVAWSAGTWLNRLLVLFTVKFPYMNSA